MPSNQSDLQAKSFKRAESSLQGKLKSTFLKSYPHNIVPGYNLSRILCLDSKNAETSITDLYREFPYYCGLPKPLFPPARLSRTVLREEDPALQLISIKSHINDDLNKFIQYYQKYHKEFREINKKDVKWIESDNHDYTELPRYVAEVTDILDSDPDPSFKGEYNWYYTGGCMSSIYLNGMNILVFPYMGELIASQIRNKNESLWRPILQTAGKCSLDKTLFETRHNITNGVCRILGRHKNYCSLYSLSETADKLSLNEIHRQSAKIPYVSADFNLVNTNQYCTLDVTRSLSIWDINQMKYVNRDTVQNTKVLEDCWGTVKFQPLDPNVILFADRCCLHYMDVRISLEKPNLTLCPKSEIEDCEKISVVAGCRSNFCRYIGTYHSLLMCDSRYPDQCVQQKWIHQFRSAPLLSCVTNRDEEEIIILSSQITGESAIILNTWMSSDNAHSYNLPFTPPNILDTLIESQKQGLCLESLINTRLQCCNIGSAVIINDNRDLTVIIQKSTGDIFYQCITQETSLDNSQDRNFKACYALNAWEQALSKVSNGPTILEISDRATMEYIHTKLKDEKLRLKCDDRLGLDYDPKWMQSIDILKFYMDILAPEFLAIWDISSDVLLPLSSAPHHKVLNWLETTRGENDVSQFQDQAIIASTAVNTQGLITLSQEPDIENIDDSNALQALLLPKVKTKGNVKRKAR